MTRMAAERIGFMQGRLSPLVDGRIQAFPWANWRAEFAAAAALGIGRMEWTLDHEHLGENPLMTEAGRSEIAALGAAHGIAVPSLTGDIFMQAPFWKAHGEERERFLEELDAVVAACGQAGIGLVVVPLVDNGRLETDAQEDLLVDALLARRDRLGGVRIVFESDFAPERLARFIARLPESSFGINYDTGNSAALGFGAQEEVAAYGKRIANVHIKDRVRGGTTVPLGEGDADLPGAVAALAASGYRGDFVLQTARAQDGDHAAALARYRALLVGWLEQAYGS